MPKKWCRPHKGPARTGPFPLHNTPHDRFVGVPQAMSGCRRFNVITFAWCAIAICSLGACGIGDLSAGIPYPGAPPTPPTNACSTGTEVALVVPLPGTHVAPTRRHVTIASNLTITNPTAALLLQNSAGVATSPQPLVGPVRKPKHAPAPFRHPVYYEARGFDLMPSQTYTVYVASVTPNCTPSPIHGAIFKTKH